MAEEILLGFIGLVALPSTGPVVLRKYAIWYDGFEGGKMSRFVWVIILSRKGSCPGAWIGEPDKSDGGDPSRSAAAVSLCTSIRSLHLPLLGALLLVTLAVCALETCWAGVRTDAGSAVMPAGPNIFDEGRAAPDP